MLFSITGHQFSFLQLKQAQCSLAYWHSLAMWELYLLWPWVR